MDLQKLQNDTLLDRYNAEKNRYLENCYIGESSTWQQQPEPEMKEEHHFPEWLSYVRTRTDRIYRQKMADQEADMKSILWNRYLEICYNGESSTWQQQPEPEMKEEHHFPEWLSYVRTRTDRIYRQKMADAEMSWLAPLVKTLPLVNTQNIKTNDGKFKNGHLAGYETYELKQNSPYVQLGLQPHEDQEADTKSILRLDHLVKKLLLFNTQNIKTNDGKFKDGNWAEYEMMKKILATYELKQKLPYEKLDLQPSEFYLKCAPAQDRGSCMSLESKFVHFMNKLCDDNNIKVEYKNFQGLEDALANTVCGEVPDYLKSIVIRIEDARGKATEFSHTGILILVCAVIKEMEDKSLEDLDWGTLKKWVTALNYANEHGFQVGFANSLLERNVVAYFQKKELCN